MNTDTDRYTKTSTTDNDTVNTNNMKEDTAMKSAFEILNAINVNEHTEKKNGLTYLSWAWAWGELKKRFSDANYIIYERSTEFGPVPYFTDGRTCWVKTGVFVGDQEHVELLPIMDFKNRSIPLEQITSTDVNKAVQRSLTKAVARHGLGLYIYAGEDLPEDEKAAKPDDPTPPDPPKKTRVAIVRDLCTNAGISLEQFGAYRNAAVKGCVIPDARVADLSDDDFEALCRFVRLNAQQPA